MSRAFFDCDDTFCLVLSFVGTLDKANACAYVSTRWHRAVNLPASWRHLDQFFPGPAVMPITDATTLRRLSMAQTSQYIPWNMSECPRTRIVMDSPESTQRAAHAMAMKDAAPRLRHVWARGHAALRRLQEAAPKYTASAESCSIANVTAASVFYNVGGIRRLEINMLEDIDTVARGFPNLEYLRVNVSRDPFGRWNASSFDHLRELQVVRDVNCNVLRALTSDNVLAPRLTRLHVGHPLFVFDSLKTDIDYSRLGVNFPSLVDIALLHGVATRAITIALATGVPNLEALEFGRCDMQGAPYGDEGVTLPMLRRLYWGSAVAPCILDAVLPQLRSVRFDDSMLGTEDADKCDGDTTDAACRILRSVAVKGTSLRAFEFTSSVWNVDEQMQIHDAVANVLVARGADLRDVVLNMNIWLPDVQLPGSRVDAAIRRHCAHANVACAWKPGGGINPQQRVSGWPTANTYVLSAIILLWACLCLCLHLMR
jgi:hypothetical protein